MRRFKDPGSLALALCRRRGPSPSRCLSAGIGRGRGHGSGDSSGQSADAQPQPAAAGRGRGRGGGGGGGGAGAFFNPSFLGAERRDPVVPEAEVIESVSFANVGPGQTPNPNVAAARRSPPGQRTFADDRGYDDDDVGADDSMYGKASPSPPSRMPSLGLGLSGFGRGKVIQESSFRSSGELLASDRAQNIPKWSQWDEKLKTIDPKEGASPEELRLMDDEETPVNVLRRPTPPVMRSRRLDQAQHGGWQQRMHKTQENEEEETPQPRYPAQTRMGSLLNLDLSQSSSFSRDAEYQSGRSQAGDENKVEAADDYSQTFKPVIQPGWSFAPEKSTPGLVGAGRGQPSSPNARSPGIGSMAFSQEEFESVNEQGRISYSERMEAALQRSSARFSRDSAPEPRYDYAEEPSRPTLNEEDAAKRAMDILNARLSRRYGRMEDWSRDGDGDVSDDIDARIRRRFPAQLSRVSRERKEPRKQIEELEAAQRKAQLSDEDAKKEAEFLKAMEKNEAIMKLQDTWDQFIKSYGEMLLEPEHELGDFTNPDIDEKPMMPLEEYLEKAKPNVMKTGLFTEKQWQRMVDGVLQNQSYFEEVVEQYNGPGRYTAKQENEDLEEIASTLPSDVGPAAQAFVQRSLTTLKSNPGFNLDEKQWMLAAMVDEFSQYPVTT